MFRLFLFFILTFITSIFATSLDCHLILIENKLQSDFLLQPENLKIWLSDRNSYTLELYQRFKAGVGEELIQRVDGGINGQDVEFLSGFPKQVKLRTVTDEIYRHYSPNFANIIKSEKILRAGPRPYILPEPHLRKEYMDLTGVFLTEPHLDPLKLWLGYSFATPYVDFKLPKGLLLLDLGDGNLLIPGPPKVADWLSKKYYEYKKQQKNDVIYQFNFDLIDRRGGIKLPLLVPILIP